MHTSCFIYLKNKAQCCSQTVSVSVLPLHFGTCVTLGYFNFLCFPQLSNGVI